MLDEINMNTVFIVKTSNDLKLIKKQEDKIDKDIEISRQQEEKIRVRSLRIGT